MDKSMADFGKRLNKIEKNHAKLSKGAKARMDKSGLVVMEPKSSVKFPLRPVVLAVLCFILFKATVFVYLGEEAYEARLATLDNGTAVEQAGMLLFRIDPLTAWVAGVATSF